MSGSKTPCKVALKDYLPFAYEPDAPLQDGPTEATRIVLHALLRQARLPIHIFFALKNPAPPENG